MSRDPFDLKNLKLPPEKIAERPATVPMRIKKRHQQFVQVPLILVDKIARTSQDKTLAVLCHLLHETWKQGGGPIKVPNGMLTKIGVGRCAKYHALGKLEALGIISVEQGRKKSPVVWIKTGGGKFPCQ